jgi:hypothetical protein
MQVVHPELFSAKIKNNNKRGYASQSVKNRKRDKK